MTLYLDKDTIEVDLTNGKTMKTDAKHVDKVQQYPLNLKTKKSRAKNGQDKYYAMCQDKKRAFPFYNQIANFKIVQYINGDSLDLREQNIQEFGAINNKTFTVGEETVEINDSEVKQHYESFTMDLKDLPKNVWILGKPLGTVFKKKNDPNTYH